MSIEKDLFRRVMGSFASGVTVVTVAGQDGEPTGFTANAVSSLSIEPRMLLVCVSEQSSTLALIEAAGSFAVNILSARQQEIAQQFATRRDNRFGGVRWRPGHETGAPVLDGALAYAECKLVGTAKGGDHVILMAEILAGDANEAEPLLYFRGRYGTYDAVVSPVIHPADIWEIW
ncbi:MAG TPA: flavin reductase family protein [Chloroflexia bacterium]|nr:flavin reductase family protein [Chloroflexia bacterium]